MDRQAGAIDMLRRGRPEKSRGDNGTNKDGRTNKTLFHHDPIGRAGLFEDSQFPANPSSAACPVG
jgi:hypothetical protein